uniref:Uncharacterized protein n=1 Tax=Arundo donax TaxID=35708 RepID=A0A0A8Y0J5_ARUDO
MYPNQSRLSPFPGAHGLWGKGATCLHSSGPLPIPITTERPM